MGMNLWMNLLKQHDLSNQGAPGGYSNWLKETFNDLSPKEVDMMKSHGMTIQDIWVLRNFLKGNVEIDPSVYPYSDEAAEAAVKRLRHAR
jgi:hypothetical protein